MNKIILLLLTLVMSACAGKGGSDSGGGGTPHVPDTTPHDYTAVFYALTNTSLVHTGTLHQVCNFGLPGFRDETSLLTLVDPNLNGGVGCAGVSNYTLEAINTGAEELYLVISIDGVLQPQELVPAGITYNFQRGF